MIAALLLAAALPACSPAQLRASTGGDAGEFNGMSHSGTYLTLRNTGRRACGVPGLPAVTFRDRAGRVLPATRRAPVGMHPGPAVVPVTIPAGGTVRTGLRWVSGPVYDRNRCADAARVSAGVGGRQVSTPIRAHLCGEAGQPIGFEQAVLQRPSPRP